MSERKVVSTASAPGAVGPYSQAIVCDGWVWVSGQIPLDPATGEMVGGDVAAQADRVLRSLREILEEAGSSMERVVKATVYLRDMADFAEVNRVYAGFFGDQPPARVCVAVSGLPKDARIEIDAVARQG